MTTESDTRSEHIGEDEYLGHTEREGDRRTWGTIALLIISMIVLLVVLVQCTARVPETVGLSRSAAEARLTRMGFLVGQVSEAPAGDKKPGSVFEQIPPAGTIMRRGATVDLIVARSSDLKLVPDVCGRDSSTATTILQQADFEASYAEAYSDSVPLDIAVEQSPLAGTMAPKGSTVAVIYSLGPQSDARVAIRHTDTDDGLTSENRDSTGPGTGQLIMGCLYAYPGATAWSSGGDIYVRLAPGRAARRVTSTGDWDTNPIISPSHKYLVFMRAPGEGRNARHIGAVCFTTFETHILTLPLATMWGGVAPFYGKPVFAPNAGSTSPDSDWIVFPQYWLEEYESPLTRTSARLVICNVPMGSSWVSWNIQFRPAHTLQLLRSGKAGCVRVRQTSSGRVLYDRDFDVSTGLYLR